MKEFKSAAKKVLAEGEEVETLKFKLDDDTLTSHRPTEGQIVMLMTAEASETRREDSQIAGMIDGTLSLFDEDTRRLLQRRLLDPDDTFDLATLLDIMTYVIEEWSNRPTKPSSDSTSSSEDGGTSSTDGASPKELTSFA